MEGPKNGVFHASSILAESVKITVKKWSPSVPEVYFERRVQQVQQDGGAAVVDLIIGVQRGCEKVRPRTSYYESWQF